MSKKQKPETPLTVKVAAEKVVSGECLRPGVRLSLNNTGAVREARDGDPIIGRTPTEDEAAMLPEVEPGYVHIVVSAGWMVAESTT